MSRILLKQLDNYIKLNPEKVSAVFDKFGIPADVKVSTYSVIDAYKYFREPFAVALFNALYPEISTQMKKPEFSNAVGVVDPAHGTESPTVATQTSWWDGFAGVLNGLVQLAPAISDTVYTIKNGKKVPVTTQTTPQPQPMYISNPPKQGIDNNILIYIGIGFLAIVAAILIFKKAK